MKKLIILLLIVNAAFAQIWKPELPEAYEIRGLKGNYYTVLPPFKPWDQRGSDARVGLSDWNEISISAGALYAPIKRPFKTDRWTPAIWYFNDIPKYRKYYDISMFSYVVFYPINWVKAYAHVQSYNYYVTNYMNWYMEEIKVSNPKMYKLMERTYVNSYEYWVKAPIYYIFFPIAIYLYFVVFLLLARAYVTILAISMYILWKIGILEGEEL